MDRLERLVNLVAALIDTSRPLTRDELKSRVGGYADDPQAFRRNFERDKELLRGMGMPLVVEAVDPDRPDDVGYRIPRDLYELPDPGLEDDELAALRLAAGAVQVEGGDAAVTTALRKLAGAAAPTRSDLGSAAQSRRERANGERAHGAQRAEGGRGGLATLPAGQPAVAAFAGIAERRRLGFSYRGERRLVDPWRMSYRNGQWYLSGFDHGRGAERVFRLDRVEGEVVHTGGRGAFDRPVTPAAAPSAPWRLGDEEEVLVEVLVDGDQAAWASRAAGEDSVADRLPDGSVILRLPVTNRAGLRSFVLGFLDHAEVLGPAGERADMMAWLRALAAQP